MHQDFLSDIELYYSSIINDKFIEIEGDEFHHLKDVMRHKIDDEIYITDGIGTIFKSKISVIEKRKLLAEILSFEKYKNKLDNFTFCIPRLKSADRFEFALEKCVELGITNFVVFDSQRTVAKGEKIERWQKILTSAMKQSLRSWLPSVVYKHSIKEILNTKGIHLLFDQGAEKPFQLFMNEDLKEERYYLIFGPEGGLSNEEISMVDDGHRIKLTSNRLRSETAIIAAATELVFRLDQ